MKSLEKQIKFIDTKLLKIFGFNNIVDYETKINISEPETEQIDLVKLNELIPEFRELFHAKNFSLHKTNYVIVSKSQAVCLLKTCLELTSIPFDVSLYKKKKYLRLISKNNILEDYIQTIKMSENRTLKNNSLKLSQKQDIITKDELISAINSSYIFYYTISNNESRKTFLTNDLKYFFKNKPLDSLKVTFKSKCTDDIPYLSSNIINKWLENVEYRLFANGSLIYKHKFTNGSELLLDSIILFPNLCASTSIEFYGFNSSIDLFSHVEVYFVGFWVGFKNKIEEKIATKRIQQEICIDNKYNFLVYENGLVGMAYGDGEFLPAELHDLHKKDFEAKQIENTPDIIDNCDELLEYVIGGTIVEQYCCNGFRLFNYNSSYDKLLTTPLKYDFITWTNEYTIDKDILKVCITTKNYTSQCYYINISGIHNSISELEITIPNIGQVKSIGIDYVGIYSGFQSTDHFKIEGDTIKIKSSVGLHINTFHRKVDKIAIHIYDKTFPDIKKINVKGKYYIWNNRYYNSYLNQDTFEFDPYFVRNRNSIITQDTNDELNNFFYNGIFLIDELLERTYDDGLQNQLRLKWKLSKKPVLLVAIKINNNYTQLNFLFNVLVGIYSKTKTQFNLSLGKTKLVEKNIEANTFNFFTNNQKYIYQNLFKEELNLYVEDITEVYCIIGITEFLDILKLNNECLLYKFDNNIKLTINRGDIKINQEDV